MRNTSQIPNYMKIRSKLWPWECFRFLHSPFNRKTGTRLFSSFYHHQPKPVEKLHLLIWHVKIKIDWFKWALFVKLLFNVLYVNDLKLNHTQLDIQKTLWQVLLKLARQFRHSSANRQTQTYRQTDTQTGRQPGIFRPERSKWHLVKWLNGKIFLCFPYWI